MRHNSGNISWLTLTSCVTISLEFILKRMEGSHSGYCTSFENWRPFGHRGFESLSFRLIKKLATASFFINEVGWCTRTSLKSPAGK